MGHYATPGNATQAPFAGNSSCPRTAYPSVFLDEREIYAPVRPLFPYLSVWSLYATARES
jgi:hypothetical protein